MMETRSEVAGKSVTKTGKKVLPLIRSLSRDGQHGGVEKKAPIEYAPATDGGKKPGRASETLPRGTEIKIT